MADRKTHLTNAFETTLEAELTSVAGSMLLADVSGLVVPFYVVIDPDNPALREYVYVTSLSGTTATIAERYLNGSAAASGLTHPAGAVVRMVAAAQHFGDVHDRIDALTTTVGTLGFHGTLAELGEDQHGHYLTVGRHDIAARHPVGTVIPTAAPGSSAVGDSAAEGVATTAARADHKHGREAFGVPGSSAPGDAVAEGVATTPARSDHKHGREAASPLGVLGYTTSPLVSDQPVNGTVDITGATVTVTLESGRLYRISCLEPILVNQNAGGVSQPLQLRIADGGGTELTRVISGPISEGPFSAGLAVTLSPFIVMAAPAPGSTTFKLQGITSGTWTVNGSINPVGLVVEDIGLA